VRKKAAFIPNLVNDISGSPNGSALLLSGTLVTEQGLAYGNQKNPKRFRQTKSIYIECKDHRVAAAIRACGIKIYRKDENLCR
jgi:hypothetical protein